MLRHIKLSQDEEVLSHQAQLARMFGILSGQLVAEHRTRTIHPDGRRENVAEHSLMLVKVAIALAEEYYPGLDAGKIAIFASLHDDLEAYVGDTPTDSIAQHDPAEKKKREAAGLSRLVQDFSGVSPSYVSHMEEYEQQVTPEARFVRVVDKIMVELIHFPNQGAVLKQYYSHDSASEAITASAQRLMAEYPEYIDLISVKVELARHLADKYLR